MGDNISATSGAAVSSRSFSPLARGFSFNSRVPLPFPRQKLQTEDPSVQPSYPPKKIEKGVKHSSIPKKNRKNGLAT